MLQSASFSAGRLANNYLNKEATAGQKAPITDTELIQLAGTIEDLQEKIISSYYEYKGALNKLKDTRSRIILYNKNYSEALKNNSITELVVSSALYEDMQLQEYKHEQEAKKYSSRWDFGKNNGSAYEAAIRNKWLNKLFTET